MKIPIVRPDSYSYSEAKKHAVELDQHLDFNIVETETKIAANPLYKSQDVEYWIGLDPQVLQTPYIELRMILEQLSLKPNESIVDLGAAYARLAFIIGEYYPQIKCICYEYVKERVEESLRVLSSRGFTNIKIEQADVNQTSFVLPCAEYYFLYDFGSRKAIAKVLNDLRHIADSKNITVIGRGRAVRDAIEREEPWLSQVFPPDHFGSFSIYYSFLSENGASSIE